MKTIYTLLVFLSALVFVSCKKDTLSTALIIPGVAVSGKLLRTPPIMRIAIR